MPHATAKTRTVEVHIFPLQISRLPILRDESSSLCISLCHLPGCSLDFKLGDRPNLRVGLLEPALLSVPFKPGHSPYHRNLPRTALH